MPPAPSARPVGAPESLPIPDTSARRRRAHRTADLWSQAAGTVDAARTRLQNDVVEANLEVARAIARRYRDRGESLDDLEQAAFVGLVKAARSFDAERGHDFLTYAVPTITGEVKRHFRDHAWTLRPPRRVQELHGRVRAARAELSQRAGVDPTTAQVAAHLEASVEDVVEAVASGGGFHGLSLEAAVRNGAGREALEAFVGVEDGGFAVTDLLASLTPALLALSDDERTIVRLVTHEGWSQQRVADVLGVSQMHVSRRLARIRSALRAAVSTDDLGECA